MNNNILNLILAVVMSAVIIFSWQYFYQPVSNKTQSYSSKSNLQSDNSKFSGNSSSANRNNNHYVNTQYFAKNDANIDGQDSIAIDTSSLSGSISLKGIRFDNLILKKYKETMKNNSPDVVLFSKPGSKETYFAEIGWLNVGNEDKIELPTSETRWSADSNVLNSAKPVNFFWVNSQGIKFIVNVSIDDDYLFTITQTVVNDSSSPFSVRYYGLINRNYDLSEKMLSILHQGPIIVQNGELSEKSYDSMKDSKVENFAEEYVNWIGISDKYWLASFIPDQSNLYRSKFSYKLKDGFNKYQVDFISSEHLIQSGESYSVRNMLFAGVKKLNLLDKYAKQYHIKIFDRAIDFGWLYVITKPIFYTLNFFYKYVGNFGISILIVTVIIKLAMFFLTNKSYRSMKVMKELQPEIENIKTLYAQDKARLHKETMALYKKHKVNPVSGCLPLILQIPIFFSIYKVLYVTIEMRHAAFYGWINDLSAPDPTTIFNLFGLISYHPPSFLMIGAWPIIMAISMMLQQKMSPTPADPTQALMMKMMPWVFLIMFSSFPAGLLIYWSWNNVLSICQQYYINKTSAKSA
ncbi:MAG: membrane protein insertase YidC [Rickettsiaceae bacterium]